ARLAEWVASEIVPRLKQDLEQQSLPASVRAEDDKVFIDYVPLSAGTGYVARPSCWSLVPVLPASPANHASKSD
ncbi:MAG: hypothetical protein JWQ23_3865, partial [Herminiimonas sp.]|nr:hypothetical protein [Herminiimonas sp.]